MKTLSNWKSWGWLITRKLSYYALWIFAVIVLLSVAFGYMTVASTFSVLTGVMMAVVTVGVSIALVIREIFYYFQFFNNN